MTSPLTEDERRIKGASVFPTAYPMDGLTKRELFAAMAMQGIATTSEHGWVGNHGSGDYEEVARRAVACADALLKELSR